ncbi:NACHT domain-containing protein [Clostridium saccharoperbutylacetonicum]|uniref:NACHT domain-containing protein n=1 Tax=Clostridium saccharoperbutylacetonicum TaxID=36745 RepID=UPI0009839A1B|nr:hypothetical protein [Clostridium saccharoperbutylacetonicum]AQR96144.1 hypothetical protein CLSAP_34630 [Clostridium saccharoperbutylacetonicum]NSB32014.1 hypothetical protein [Clostridium saccharoperbutylacetonicum]
MQTDINFTNIREYDNSKQNGFEELVCQIAHIEKPVTGKTFVRKEGSGGDAGVECFWILENGGEYAWQAKYFLEPLNSNQWEEINISVKAAIKKHKQLKRYYVCLPRDRTDSRRESKGTKVKSALDIWNEHVERWTQLAKENGMNVEFEYWGKHEIAQFLQQDKPEYVGKILYWFNAAVVSSSSLMKLAENSKQCLGERYTQEHNIELPISQSLSCIGNDSNWKNSLKELLSDIYDLRKRILEAINNSLLEEINEKCINLKSDYEEFLNEAFKFEKDDNVLFDNLEWYKQKNKELLRELSTINAHIYDKYNSNKELRNAYNHDERKIDKIIDDLYKFKEFFNKVQVNAGKERMLLITGEGGSGKSHLLCDITLKRLKNNLPTVFLLGQHYSGKNPIRFIAENLNLSNYSDEEVLGALDSLGENYKCRILIIIDAINEGNYKRDWLDFLDMFLQKCKRYKNLAIVLSCRSTYLEYIIPEDILSNIPRINHEGFKGFESRAAREYLGGQGIILPNMPFFSPEFSNPLFLKTACKAIKDMGFKEFPKGLKGFNEVFEFYLNNVERIVKKEKNTHLTKIVHKSIKAFIKELYPDNLSGLPCDESEEIINKYDCKSSSKTLFDILLFEGVLSLDISKDENQNEIEVVRFTYERFCDYAVAQHILENCNTEEELQQLFKEGNLIFNLIKKENRYKNTGIIEALGIEIAEKFKKEFLEYINPERGYEYNWFLEKTFQNGILSRTVDTITDKSLELLNRLRGDKYHSSSFDILIALSTEPEHPWNAEFLYTNLRRKKLADRDAFWSTYVAINDIEEDEETPESSIRTLLNWVFDVDISKADKERLRLAGIMLLWLTTTSNRMIRQEATKAFSKVLYNIPDKIISFIENYNDIDDDYLVTSLYGGAYGAIVNIKDKEIIKEVAEKVIDKQFKADIEYPNILIRDYARGIVEYAEFKGAIDIDIDEYRPPYKSKWPLDNPLQSEIEKICGGDYEIKNSVQGFIGDFGRYVLNTVEYWTSTLISDKKAKSIRELKYEFAQTLPEDLKDKYTKVLDEENREIENEEEFDLEEFIKSISEKEIIEEQNDTELFENEKNSTIKEIKARLDEKKLVEFKWICNQGRSDRPVIFSHDLACRWVIKRAYELGWTSKLFDDFERIYCKDSYRIGGNITERIGKKYEWIAYYELLARLADNLMFGDRGYCDVDDSKFYGPWQVDIREMDPTFWFKGCTDDICYDDSKIRWWRPYQFNVEIDNLEEQIKWLWNKENLPNFDNIICTKDNNEEEWLNLSTFCDWKMKVTKHKDELGEPNLWYRINTCIIKRKDLDKAKKSIINKPLRSPDIVYVSNSHNQKFFGEYPWHPCYNDFNEWEDLKIPCKYNIPVFEYRWSTENFSHVKSEHNNFYMPSKKIVNEMNINNDINTPNCWYKDGKLIFMDPVFEYNTQPCALIKKDIMCQWLNENDYVLLWLIGGEKQLFTIDVDKFYGRLVYSAFYSMDGSGKIEGEIWTEEEKPLWDN